MDVNKTGLRTKGVPVKSRARCCFFYLAQQSSQCGTSGSLPSLAQTPTSSLNIDAICCHASLSAALHPTPFAKQVVWRVRHTFKLRCRCAPPWIQGELRTKDYPRGLPAAQSHSKIWPAVWGLTLKKLGATPRRSPVSAPRGCAQGGR